MSFCTGLELILVVAKQVTLVLMILWIVQRNLSPNSLARRALNETKRTSQNQVQEQAA